MSWSAEHCQPANDDLNLHVDFCPKLTTPSTHYRLSDGTVFTSVRRHWAKKENYVCTCVYHHREVRLKSFNYRCSWSDGWSNQMLRLDEYGGGDEAEYNSWVILEKAAAVREEAGGS